MRQAPLAVQVFSVLLGASPLWLVWLMQQEAPGASVFVPAALFMLSAPAIGLGLWRVKRKAWIGLQVFSFLAVGVGLSHIMVYPDHVAPMGSYMVLVAFIALTAWRPGLRKPYLAGDGRGFRKNERHQVDMPCNIVFGEAGSQGIWTLKGVTVDLSEGGVYVQCETDGLQVDSRCMFDAKLRDQHLRARARVAGVFPEGIRSKPRGIGIEFLNLVSTDRQTIGALIHSGRRHQRAPVQLPIAVSSGSREVQLNTLNLSRGGAFVADPNFSFQPGDQVMFKLELHPGDEIEGFAEVAWAPEEERALRPAGFALQFQKMSRNDLQRLKERLADFGAQD